LPVRKWLNFVIGFVAFGLCLAWGFSLSEELIKYVVSGFESTFLAGIVFFGLTLIAVFLVSYKIRKEEAWGVLIAVGLGAALSPLIRITGLSFENAWLVIFVLVIVSWAALDFFKKERKAKSH